MKRALLLMTLLVCLVLRAEATATTSIEGDTTLTITVTEAGDVAAIAAGISTSYPNVTRVNIVGEGVTPSANDLAAIEKFTAIRILDLSKVKIEYATAYKNIKTDNNRKISLVVAAAKDENDGTVVDDQVEYLRNIFKTVVPNAWDHIFNAIYVYNTNTNGNHTCHAFMTTYNNSGLKDIDVLANGQDNLNIISLDDAWAIKNNLGKGKDNDILVALNNVNVKRLVLANVFGGWAGEPLETFTNPHVKALTLPTGSTDLTKEEDRLKNIKLGKGAAAKAFMQLVCANGEGNNPYSLYGYSAEAGTLATLGNDHYYQSDINDAYKEVYFGNINIEDFNFFKGIKNKRLDLSNLTHVDADGNEIDINPALNKYKNEYIEYLVLPESDDYPTDPTFNNWFEGENACKNLKAVGIKISEKLTPGSIRNSIVISSNERGGIYSIAELMGNNRLRSAQKYQLSGLAYAKDLGSWNMNIKVDENGHLTVSEKDNDGAITKGETGTDVTGILDFTNATDFDYSHLRLWNKGENISEEEKKAAQNDLCLSQMGYGNTLTSIKLPTDESVYRLPSSFCPEGVTKLQSICIPANYTEIGSCAFRNCNNLVLVYTTAKNKAGKSGYLVGGKFQEQEPDITDENTEHTVQLPTNLKRIEKNAFANVEQFTDVYVTTNNAGDVPYCEKDAFSSGTLQGWGGFDGKHPITRKNYQNSTNKVFGILHFPSGLPKAKAELFTDLQRNYSLVDEAGTTDGNGNVFIWPKQEEWYRSFYQANTGYTWNNWTERDENGSLYTGEKIDKREDLADKNGNLTENAKKYGLTAISGENAIYNSFAPKNPNYGEGSSESILEQNDTWIGWHQFVLVGAYDYENPDEKKWHFSTSDNNWWTICLPFNMTAKQIEDTWGEGTKLCTLTGVTRNYTKNLICLEFGKDLVQEAKENTNTGNVLKWRIPYMIKPAKTYTSENGEAYTGPTFTLSDEQSKTLEEATKKITAEVGKNPRPQTDDDPCCITVQAKDENGNLLNTTAGTPYMYTFLGSYTKQYIPTYAYFLAWCEDPTNTNGWVNYFYQTEKPTIKNWNAYTSIVGHFNVEEATWTIPDNEAGKWAFSCSSDTEQRDAHEDALPNPSGDTKVKLAFDEGNATAIGHMTANGSIQSVENATVYNLNGQVVAHNGNVEGLPKGVYIIAGKKFIVK